MNGAPASAPAAPNTGAGGPPKVIRRKPAASVFATAKPRARVAAAPTNGSVQRPAVNGQLGVFTPNSQRSASPAVSTPRAKDVGPSSGFSDPDVAAGKKAYTDYKLVATKRDLLDGLRHHILQLMMAEDNPLDVRDPDQFAQPAHLHRRDPNAAIPGQHKDDTIEHKDGLTAAEREDLNQRKEQRQIERAANLAQIAPSHSSRKFGNSKSKTKQVYKADFTDADKRRIQTNYEEKLPWHLEDFDGKHCFIGQNQATSQNRHAAFAYEPSVDAKTGKFRLIPVEKVYEFQARREPSKVQTSEDAEKLAEKLMKARKSAPNWLAQVEEKTLMRKRQALAEQSSRKLYSGVAKNDRMAGAGRGGEDDDMDFEEEELFADDEEGDIHKNLDEDEKMADRKIKEDQKMANFFEVKEEREYDEDEEQEKQEEQERKENSRGLRKKLEKHEKRYELGSDSEYSASDSEDDEERERLEQEKQNGQKGPDGADPKKLAAPLSGATTPSGRKEKTSGMLSDAEVSRKKLKRPGSPNLSDASGTDTSSRKKTKKLHISAPNDPTRLKVRNPSFAGAGSGSDTDTSRTRIRLKTSPVSSQLPSRAGSPLPRESSATPKPAANTMPTLDDIKDAVRNYPAPGPTIKELLNLIPYPKDKKNELMEILRGHIKTTFGLKSIPDANGGVPKRVVQLLN